MNIQDLEYREFLPRAGDRSPLLAGGMIALPGPGGQVFTVTPPTIELLSLVNAFSFPVGIDLGQFANVQAGNFSVVRASSNIYIRNTPLFFS